MEIPFTKMHGLGNNYIYINVFDYPIEEALLPELAKDVSNVHTGIGSDGLILITPSERAPVGMRMFNKDGSEGKTCGNGLRCVAKYVYEHQLVSDTTFSVETRAGVVQAEVQEKKGKVHSVTIDMGKPLLHRKDIPMKGSETDKVVNEPFLVDETELRLTAVSMGNPHAVFFVDQIEKAPLYELGPAITGDHRFPEGVNVDFAEIIQSNEMNFRVWERGSGVTQACGSGACAAVVAAVLNGFSERGQEVCVHLTGGDLWITWEHDGPVRMRGPAETTAIGTYYWNKTGSI